MTQKNIYPVSENTVMAEGISPLLSTETARFNIHFKTEKPFSLKGAEPLIRGRFGLMLKQSCCPLPDFRNTSCDGCTLLLKCLYVALFSPAVSQKQTAFQGKITPKHFPSVCPFVFSIKGDSGKIDLDRGEDATITFSLFGPAIQYCSLFLNSARSAISTLSLHIQSIENIFPLNTQPGGNTPSENISWPLAAWIKSEWENDASRDAILKLHCITPLRLMKNGRPLRDQFSFATLITSVIRRLRDLKRSFGADQNMGEIQDDFFKFSETVTIHQSNLFWFPEKRYSSRQRQDVLLNGLIGQIQFIGQVAPFYPILKAGEIVHIGKSVSNGCGRIVADYIEI
jgi:hypothetical protein